jgi:hypothetical protein
LVPFTGVSLSQDEYIIGERAEIERFAKAQRWRPYGRSSWLTADDTKVHYLHFPEQLAALAAGATLHVVGVSEIVEMSEDLEHLTIVPHG